MPELLQKVAAKYVKPKFTDVRSGDTVRVYTTVTEGSKTRTQYFEGLVIRRRGGVSPDASFTVRRIASGVGVERTFPLHSPVITDIRIVRGAKVRRAQLHYMRERAGKSARLREQPVRQADRDTDHPWLQSGDVKSEVQEVAAEKSTPKSKAEKAADKADASDAKPAAGKSDAAPAESKGTAAATPKAGKAEKKPDAKADKKPDAKSDDKPKSAAKRDASADAKRK